VTIHYDLLDYVSSHITLEVMYAGMNSWCPDEPPTLVSQTRQEEEEEEGSLKETYSSYIYKILKQIYSDTGISNKARRRRERKSKRRYISLTCTNLTLVSQTRQEEEGKRKSERNLLFLHLQGPQANLL